MAEPILEVKNLDKRFGALVVSDDVTFDLQPGECHALIGPNGAGKTTLVHQISGLLAPDAGTIHFAGEDVTRLPVHARAARGLARTFQITAVVPGFTALDNTALAVQRRSGTSFRFWGNAAKEAALNEPAREALATVGLEAKAHVPAANLAHGEKRALELAIALAMQPKALLLDEPMAGVGHDEGRQLLAVLARLKAHVPMLLVEHDMHAVFSLADRISVLVYGRILASGDPEAVRADAEVRRAYLGEAA
ncbi:MAG: ABC transporter ATP-binding protein [Geminicoccaceae bacterium]|nr:MAG: ABC transporter ATP-binding protein [Geminicoccaceae bacterium]